MRHDLRDYFQFSVSQTRAILVLSVLCALGGALYFSLPLWLKPNATIPENDAQVEEILARIYVDTAYRQQEFPPQKLTPFRFDPNTLSEQGFSKLGLRPRLVKTILNYRSKGGTFNKPTDFKKIWGLHEDEYRQLASFIDISNTTKWSENTTSSSGAQKRFIIEINTATEEEFIRLNGIGEKLAANILNYRKQLGGFYNIKQLNEVFGIRPETFETIKPHLHCNPKQIRQININTATLSELRLHPYLRQQDIALEITRFRKAQDYEIKAIADLKNVVGMTDEIYDKIVPYLGLQ